MKDNNSGVNKNVSETTEKIKDLKAAAVNSGNGDTKIILWPLLLMLLLILLGWLFLYNELVFYAIIICIFILSAFCIVFTVYLLIKNKWEKSLFLICSILIASLLGVSPVNVLLPINTWPIRKNWFHSRHYVEFLIQKNTSYPEMNDLKNLPNYKEWKLKKYSGTDYVIIFDSKDEIIKKDRTISEGCGYSVYRVGEHFYVFEMLCGI